MSCVSTKDELTQIFPNGNISMCKYDAIQLFEFENRETKILMYRTGE